LPGAQGLRGAEARRRAGLYPRRPYGQTRTVGSRRARRNRARPGSPRRVHPNIVTSEPVLTRQQIATAVDFGAMRDLVAASGGMDAQCRPDVWPRLLGLTTSWPARVRVDDDAQLDEEYARLCERAAEVDTKLTHTIDADIPRTDDLSADEQQALRETLRALLLAHCVLEPKWGYFQGMNDIGRIVLSACEPRGGAGGDGAGAGAGRTFWLLRGVLAASSENWAHPALEGVWRQARAVRSVLLATDRRLASKLDSLDVHGGGGGSSSSRGGGNGAAHQQPFAFLFGPIFLRLKRECVDMEQAMRLWEVTWANGSHFHVLVLAAFVRTQREQVLRIKSDGAAELHQLFGRLHGTVSAVNLLDDARSLRSKPGVLAALVDAMGGRQDV
jgi:hypothetical protein